MSCNTCSRKFNIFTPERGCPSCGFSYCRKCLNQTMFVKKYNKNEKVCSKCKLAQTELGNKSAELAHETTKEIRNTETINKSSQHTNDLPSTTNNINQGCIEKDKELADRLQRLKDERINLQNPSSNEEIENRLMRLKGLEPKQAIKNFSNHLDLRSNEEKTSDLLAQYLDECEIENQHHNPDSHLQARLDTLRGTSSVSKEDRVEVSEDEDEETLAQKLVERYSEEVKLANDSEDTFDDSEDKTDELPWCFLCNEDAALRCVNCSGDLFCRLCFKQSHKEWNYPNHKAVPYLPKKAHSDHN